MKVFHAGTRVQARELVTAGGRVLGITAAAENLPSAIARAYAAVSKVTFEGMHYRKDIGAKGLRRLWRNASGPSKTGPGKKTGGSPATRTSS